MPGSPHVGLVGDTDFFWVPLSSIVRQVGFACTVFSDAEEAIQDFPDLDPPLDAIVVDLSSPDLAGGTTTGLDLVDRIVALRGASGPRLICVDNVFDRADPEELSARGVALVVSRAARPAVVAAQLKDAIAPSWQGEDQRSVPRVPTCFPVEYRVGDRTASGYCGNLSSGGMYVLSRSPALLGEDVAVKFALPEEGEVHQAEGRVLYVSDGEDPAGGPAGMGLKFLEIQDATRDAIQAYVERELERRPTDFQVIFGMELPG